ncbi:MAG: 6,7-dimethyl-8-ribityllumazine synthase [Pirellulales bacterium]|nr:6,7-dimethyl-8-ribityllumazine synthase [Pirellulales bacterium]
MRTYSGQPVAASGRVAIVVSRYNETVTSRLLTGALETLRARGLPDDRIEVAWAPGAFELPMVADKLAGSQRYQAVICLGAVIRGETTHDQYINRAVSLGLAEIARHWGLPVLFGVLTCETLEQAIHRSGGNVGNKGAECAEAALEMIDLYRQFPD